MDYKFMKEINDHQIQKEFDRFEKEIDREMDRQAKLKKQEFERAAREELINGLIAAAIVLLLVIAGGFVNAI